MACSPGANKLSVVVANELSGFIKGQEKQEHILIVQIARKRVGFLVCSYRFILALQLKMQYDYK
jgi:hypothetical protein